jgi:glutaminyl-tRNA synthetase
VLDPLKLVITNLPDGHAETLALPNHPKDESAGSREVPFARELWIERDDFAEAPPKGFKRLVAGGEVRLRGVGIVRCGEVVKDAAGEVAELRCTLDPESRHGMEGANRKVKGTIHWVSARHAVDAEVRLYDRLFDVADPDDDRDGGTWLDHVNPDSRRSIIARLEPSLRAAQPEHAFQFERTGYFVADRHDHAPGRPVFNRTVTLRDTWSKHPSSDGPPLQTAEGARAARSARPGTARRRGRPPVLRKPGIAACKRDHCGQPNPATA